MARNCKSCRWFTANNQCRRFPPQIIVLGADQTFENTGPMFPIMDETDWCGEWMDVHNTIL